MAGVLVGNDNKVKLYLLIEKVLQKYLQSYTKQPRMGGGWIGWHSIFKTLSRLLSKPWWVYKLTFNMIVMRKQLSHVCSIHHP